MWDAVLHSGGKSVGKYKCVAESKATMREETVHCVMLPSIPPTVFSAGPHFGTPQRGAVPGG